MSKFMTLSISIAFIIFISGYNYPMYEHHRQPLLPVKKFVRRLARHGAIAFGVVFVSLLIGMAGYRTLEGQSWLDSFLNAAMILGGMGPVNPLHTHAGKFFAGCYALYSGLIFLVVIGVVFAPVFHRFLHRFHLDIGQRESAQVPRTEKDPTSELKKAG